MYLLVYRKLLSQSNRKREREMGRSIECDICSLTAYHPLQIITSWKSSKVGSLQPDLPKETEGVDYEENGIFDPTFVLAGSSPFSMPYISMCTNLSLPLFYFEFRVTAAYIPRVASEPEHDTIILLFSTFQVVRARRTEKLHAFRQAKIGFRNLTPNFAPINAKFRQLV